MIPIRDVIPSQGSPAATIALIAVQVAVWIGRGLVSVETATPLPSPPSGLSTAVSTAGGVFFHNSVLHLVGNVWALWIFGENVENRLGRRTFLFFYLLCGVSAALTEAVLAPGAVPVAGSSGATAAVIGAYVALYPPSRVLTFVPLGATWDLVEVPAGWLVLVWCSVQLVATGALAGPAVGSGAALAAIAGSLVAGTAAGLVLRRRRRVFPVW